MNEYLMRAYLKKRDSDDEAFIRKMKNVLSSERYARGRARGVIDYDDMMGDDYYINRHSDSQLSDIVEDLDPIDKDRLFKMMLEGRGSDTHFDEITGKHLVSKMYHTSGGRKFLGEKYDMLKAKEVYDRYKGIIPANATIADVYVALNAAYHDYCELLKAWFGSNIDTKVIEAAVNFWFKDDDFKDGNKVYKYLGEA